MNQTKVCCLTSVIHGGPNDMPHIFELACVLPVFLLWAVSGEHHNWNVMLFVDSSAEGASNEYYGSAEPYNYHMPLQG